MTSLRVVVADDHPLMLSAIVARLSAETDIDVVATATTCAGLVDAVTQHAPDVALADVSMPDGSTIESLGDIATVAPHTRVLLLSATEETRDVAAALEAGAAGFLSKEVDPDDVPTHVRNVAAGETVLDMRSAAAVAAELRNPASDDTLSPRELEVLSLVAVGRSNKEIGQQLFVSMSTVKTHLERIFSKLNVPDRAAAVARAKDLRLL